MGKKTHKRLGVRRVPLALRGPPTAALPHLRPLAKKASNSAPILQERARWLCSAEQLVKIAWSPARREKAVARSQPTSHGHGEDLWAGGKGFCSQPTTSRTPKHPSEPAVKWAPSCPIPGDTTWRKPSILAKTRTPANRNSTLPAASQGAGTEGLMGCFHPWML